MLDPLKIRLNEALQGKSEAVELVLAAWLAGGHILLEDIPGSGKTTLAKSLASAIHGTFHRIQFTPDLLPSDLLGGSVYHPPSGEFKLQKGSIFCHFLLVDEINRASPRTQSALLEAMAERQVSLEGHSYPLPQPFTVIATQNPLELHGTHPLPEAQLDRFLIKISLGYPSPEVEKRIVLEREEGSLPPEKPLYQPEDLTQIQQRVKKISIHDQVGEYLMQILWKTREESSLEMGASTRAGQHLLQMSKALAYLNDRDRVLPEDIYQAALPVLNHRLRPKNGKGSSNPLIEKILHSIPAPK